MILSISLSLLIAGSLLVLLNRTEIPEIPVYIFSGLALSFVTSLGVSRGFISQGFVETEIMRELALLGLSILVFYSTSGMLVDANRSTAVNAFKSSLLLSVISFFGITGISLYLDFTVIEALMFGVTASVGSTLLDSGLVKEEARKDHIFGWLTEDMNFYDDLFGLTAITVILSSFTGIYPFQGFLISLAVILFALISRDIYSRVMIRFTEGINELILLCGITTLVGFVWLTELAGLSALAGVYAAGLIMVNTELGYRVRERFSAVKDFFTALSFISIGYILTVPGTGYIVIAAVLVVFTTVVRPLIGSQILKLQGYDLRTSFMASIQSAQISEIVVVGALLLSPLTNYPVFEVISIAFISTTLISHLIEDREQQIFETLFSSYELDPEKSLIPEDLDDHVIIAGYDWKTEGLEELVERPVIVVDYSLERVEEAERRNIPHILADLNSDKTWEKLKVEQASVIVSAIESSKVMNKISDLDTEAEKVLIQSDSDEVREELRKMLRRSLDKEEK